MYIYIYTVKTNVFVKTQKFKFRVFAKTYLFIIKQLQYEVFIIKHEAVLDAFILDCKAFILDCKAFIIPLSFHTA